MDAQDFYYNLMEVREEISRVNKAAGYTVFNPTATQCLDAVLRQVTDRVIKKI